MEDKDKQALQNYSEVQQEAPSLASGFAKDGNRRPKLTTELEEEEGGEINMEDSTHPVDAAILHLSDEDVPPNPNGGNSKRAQIQEHSGPGIINADEPKGDLEVQGKDSEPEDKPREEGEELETNQPSAPDPVGILNDIIAEKEETFVPPSVERKGKLIIEEEIGKKKVHIWQLVSQQL